MANIYSYDIADWVCNNVTLLPVNAAQFNGSFVFSGVGAYATTTILGSVTGPFSSELYVHGFISPQQGNLTQGLKCNLDIYSKQDAGSDYWDIESHLMYLKGDSLGEINQKVTTSGGYFGFFDHIDIRLEVMSDALMAANIINLTLFTINDTGFIPDLPEIRTTLATHTVALDNHGMQITEIISTVDENGERLDTTEERVASLEAGQLTITETFVEGGVNLLANPTYGGRYAPDKAGWHTGLTAGNVNARFSGALVSEALAVIGDLTIEQIFAYEW